MKKILALLTIALAASAFAVADEDEPRDTIKFSGEAKSGVYWEDKQTMGVEPERNVKLHSTDDAGGNMGRFRLNMDYERADGFGMRTRLQFHEFRGEPNDDWFKFGFGFGNFFDRQLTVSVGKLGGSPWSTGGPEMWKELEESSMGMRVEFKPSFIPEKVGRFNVGFVLNDHNSAKDQGWPQDKPLTIFEILSESVLGISYTHDYFHGRFAYRLDGEWDIRQNGAPVNSGGLEGDELVYRLEERALKNYLPGFQLWMLGYWSGVGAISKEFYFFQNWFFAQYDPPQLGRLETPFTAQVRLGLDYTEDRAILHFRPNFYWHFFHKLISVGASFLYGQDFGEKRLEGDHPYTYIEIEPKLQFNFQSSYIAFVYNWRREYKHDFQATDYYTDPGKFAPIDQRQYINVRFCIYF